MYLKHFGLKKMPFDISPDPSFLWFGEKHREALAYLKYGILEDRRFLVITGDVGTGKTALIKCIVKMIDVGAIVVTIPDPDMSRLDFYNFLAHEFNMGRHFNSKGEFLIHFKNFLLTAYRSYKKVLIIIDEAQRLNHDLLHEIRFLANIDFGGRMLINIFLVGQNEFKEMLMDDRNKSIRDRITASYQLEPLTETEVFSYIRHRLQIAGTTNLIFTPEAIHTVYRHTKGYPRLINILCDRALLNAYVREKRLIDPTIIEETAQDLKITIGGYQPEEKKGRKLGSAALFPFKRSPRRSAMTTRFAMISLLFLLGFVVYLYRDSLSENFQRLKNFPIASRITGWFPGVNQDNMLAQKQGEIESRNALGTDQEGDALSAAANAQSKRRQSAYTYEDFKWPLIVRNKIGVPDTAEPSDQAKDASSQSNILPTAKKTGYVLQFAKNSDKISPQTRAVLNRISGMFFDYPVKEITIKGYTDPKGNESNQRYLSVERALRVKNFLVRKGIPASSVKVLEVGSQNSSGPNQKRTKNRQLEIEISMIQVQTE
jgi:general secretion pathway protein A